jgi:membrane protein
VDDAAGHGARQDEGEDSQTGAHHDNDARRCSINSGKLSQAAEGAARAVDGPEGPAAGIVFSAWSAFSGLEARRTLLNRSYGLDEGRSTWKRRWHSIVLGVITTRSLMVLSAVVLIGPVSELVQHVQAYQRVWSVVRYSSAWLLVVLVLIALHVALLNAKMRPRHVRLRAAVTATRWALGGWLFSLCVDPWANFSIMDGHLGGNI